MTGRHASRFRSMGPVFLPFSHFAGPRLKTGLQCQRLAALVRLTGWDRNVRWFPIRQQPSAISHPLQFSHLASWPGLTLSAHKRRPRPMTPLWALDDKKCADKKPGEKLKTIAL